MDFWIICWAIIITWMIGWSFFAMESDSPEVAFWWPLILIKAGLIGLFKVLFTGWKL